MPKTQQKANANSSFSQPINRLVVGCFGIAFLLIYTASAVLLYLSEEDTKAYYLRAVGMFGAYLLLFLLASLYISRRIWKMFVPLDRLAVGLARDEVFVDSEQRDLKVLAESLRTQAEQMEDLEEELLKTQEGLRVASRASRESRDEQYMLLSRCMMELERLQKKREDMEAQSLRLEECIAGALPIEQQIKERKSALYDLTVSVEGAVRENLRQHQDTEAEFQELNANYTLLDHMHGDASELIETLYSETSTLQAAAAQTNLISVNTSLDIARSGVNSISAISALDEIKELTGRMSAKTDDILLLIIRIRNALKLAQDQTGECREKGEECGESFTMSGDGVRALSSQLRELLDANDEISDRVMKLSSGVYEMKLIEESREREAQKLSEASARLQRTLREWKAAGRAE